MKEIDQVTFSRREFSQLMLMFMSIIGMGASARAGVDAPAKKRGKRIAGGVKYFEDVSAVTLSIDIPTDDGWRIIHRLDDDDWRQTDLDPDDISPKVHRQLLEAKAAPWETPVLARVLGDPVAVFIKARYFEPGEFDDRGEPEDTEEAARWRIDHWRIEWFGDGIRRVPPDNNSWWQKRLEVPPEFSKRERAFAEVWLKENNGERNYDINYGNGLIQDQMLSTWNHEKPEGFEPWLTNRERKIVATFVQWLGTNCGQGFLYEVKRKGGMPGL